MKNTSLLGKLWLIGCILLFNPCKIRAQLSEGFETGLPTSYLTGDVCLLSGTWNANKISNSTAGVQTGTYSCKLKAETNANIIAPNISSDGVGTVSFYASVLSGSGSIQVNYSTNGGTSWNDANGSPFALSSTIIKKTATTNSISPNILVQFRRTQGTVLIDDIVISYYTTWSGATDTDWSTTTNWTNGIPTSSYNVTIPTGLSNYPTISSSTTANCYDLTIESGASLTIQSNASNSGSLIVNGTSSGNVTYQRYVTGNKWHLIASPVAGQDIGDLLVTGSNNIVLSESNYSMKDYDENSDSWNTLFTAADDLKGIAV